MARGLMSDAEWSFFEPFLRGVRAPQGRPAGDRRRVLDGVFWIARTGSAWRDLPEEFGKWSSVYRQVRRWTLAGLWEAILEALNEGASLRRAIARPASDGRQHHRAGASARCGGKGGSARQGVGRSRGGLTTKIHLRVNAWGLPMRADVTPGQTSDHRGFDLVMGDDLPAPAALLGDKGYDSDRIRAWAEARDAVPVIPMRRCRKARTGIDRALLSPAQPDRALHRPAQAQPPPGHPIRQDRRQLPRLRRPRLHPTVGPGFCQHSLGVEECPLSHSFSREGVHLSSAISSLFCPDRLGSRLVEPFGLAHHHEAQIFPGAAGARPRARDPRG